MLSDLFLTAMPSPNSGALGVAGLASCRRPTFSCGAYRRWRTTTDTRWWRARCARPTYRLKIPVSGVQFPPCPPFFFGGYVISTRQRDLAGATSGATCADSVPASERPAVPLPDADAPGLGASTAASWLASYDPGGPSRCKGPPLP